MKLSFEELRKADNHTYNLDLDLSNIKIDDALIKQINEVKGSLNIMMVDSDSMLFKLDADYNVDYLDARTLNPLKLDFSIVDDLMLTSSESKAIELDIDLIEDDEIDVDQLVFELIMVNIPFNYSESEDVKKDNPDEENVYHPFKNLLTEEE